ncbi:DUF4368 domain-containing protein [Bengtsoniella intestinalis]|uniref:DUF4368 domain-containing protein n=1 Tax=Bengtsoniella intestinalis TaxID=3073143 RepID=UPI00391F77ED
MRKYTRARKLTPRMLGELVEKIEIYQAEKVDGVKQQCITIHYNCSGSIVIPEDIPLQLPDINMTTRQGVSVTYGGSGCPATA